MKINKPYPLLLICAIPWLHFSCGSGDSGGTTAQETEERFEVFTLKKSTLAGNFSLPGELKPFEAVNIYPKASGFVRKVNVDRGSRVKKNEVLAEIDAPEIVAEMAAAKAGSQAAEGEVLKQKALWETSKDHYERMLKTSQTPGAISQGDMLQVSNKMREDSSLYVAAQSQLEASRSLLRASEQMAAYLTIRAPFDGVITERNVHTGTFISQQGSENKEPMFRLEMTQKLRLEIPVPEAFAGLDFQGDSVNFEVNTRPGTMHKAVITRQAGGLRPQTRTEMIEADIVNQDLSLLGGSFAQVNLNYHKENTYIIPTSALVSNLEDRFVVRVVEKQAERVSVRRGLLYKDEVEVFGNLREGDQLLLSPPDNIQTGQTVQISAP
ncbi:efflux RND transporter periplasmic adaptor subunit [Pleomorphovibrio marinus]|uniref:efflux RND transporter periplasmic adaptor subunit n=1 Tax=Pleomorphovibrio marinus TaxID=2164132 RepID=UPI000E0A1B81|nr:efflux RND transporter periplasmic adaptor subunit [Pleomorphovibrio marinus]